MTSAPPPAPPSLDPPYYQPPPPPPPGPPVRGQLRRSRTDKVVGGVAGGLAGYSGIDPLLWRVGFIALTFAGGSGILVYLLLWLLMPAAAVTAGDEAAADRPAEPAGPRSPVPGVTIAGLLIVLGVLALVTRFTDWDPGARGFLGGALLVVGVGLVAAAFSGGRTAKGGLITLGIVLSVALLFASAVPWRNVDGVGDRTFRPVTATEVLEVYRGGVGDMTVDLTRIDVSDLDEPVTLRIEHGVGDVQVRLPDRADARIAVDSGLGSVDLLGQGSLDGGFFPGHGSGSWVDDDEPEFDIRINAGVGDVEVSRG